MKSTRLKPLFGMRPGVYITAAAAFLLILILFLLLVLPGILYHGARVSITTGVPGAAVFVDDKFAGSTPLEVFIKSGTRVIKVEKPYFTAIESEVPVPGRLFFSRVFPKRTSLSFDLTPENIPGYLSWRLQDVYQWSLITNYTRTYQYPPILSRAADDMLAAPEILEDPAFGEFISLLPYLSSSASIREDIDEFSRKLSIPVEAASKTLFPGTSRFSDTVTLVEENLEFVGVESDIMDHFYISAGLIDSELFQRFIQENPFWDTENLEKLIDAGLADDTYLQSYARLTDRVINVSYYAAEAFAQWLDALYPGYTITLPDALQWESAALASGGDDLYGLWQWTSSYFYPGNPDAYQKKPSFLSLNPHFLLKGGFNQAGDEQPAALAPNVCSPVTGIRLILLKD